MKFLFDNTELDTTNLTEIGRGGEGSVFKLNESKCFKLLFPSNQSELKYQKILALCDKARAIDLTSYSTQLALPEKPGYSVDEDRKVVGYSMKKMSDLKLFNSVLYDLKSKKFLHLKNDKEAIDLIEEVFSILKLLHENKIILGDVNPENIQINGAGKVCVMDVDSAKVGEMPSCGLAREEYNCPEILRLRKNEDGKSEFSKRSDIFILSIMCFELMIGYHPFQMPVKPMVSTSTALTQNVNLMRFATTGLNRVEGHALFEDPMVKQALTRISEIKQVEPRLYSFFESIFCSSNRPYFSSKADTRRKAIQRPVRLRHIKPKRGHSKASEKTDPKSLTFFINQYNLQIE